MEKLTAQEVYDFNCGTYANKINELIDENQKLRECVIKIAQEIYWQPEDEDIKQGFLEEINKILK
jgi:hypothetical protein